MSRPADRRRRSRTGPMPGPEARRRLELAGMDPAAARRVLEAADASLDPVPDPALPRPYTDVYACKTGPGYTLGAVTGG